MIFDIFVISILFFIGIFLGFCAVLFGLKAPLKDSEYFNTCNNCNSKYRWYELIPIISYFVNKGKCKYCNNKLSWWYVVLEMISGILFSLGYIKYNFSYEMLIFDLLIVLLVIIFVSDFNYFIILDSPLIIFGTLVLILKYIFFGFEAFLISLCSGFLIFIFMMIVKYLGDKAFKQESIGGGDIKLAMFFGFVLEIRLSILALVVGSFLAFPYAIYCSISDKQKEIPFGPFLVMGLVIVFMFMEPLKYFLNIIF